MSGLLPTHRLADFGQNLNLKAARGVNHANVVGHSYGGLAAALRQAQPCLLVLLGQAQRLRLQPREHALWHSAGGQRIKLVDRDARHARTRQAAG